ncbi:hypothetical protein Tco_0428862 [Tanacetum coccineum]
MSSHSDDIQAAGSDTRPPMLDRTDYESWSQRIWLYCRGMENGVYILQSIDQAQALVNPTGPLVTILIDQEAPSGSHSSSSSGYQSSSVHQGVTAEHLFKVNPFAAADPNHLLMCLPEIITLKHHLLG